MTTNSPSRAMRPLDYGKPAPTQSANQNTETVGNRKVPGPKPILNVLRLPARLDFQETADLLGFRQEHIPILIRAGLLKPLGNPAANAPKFFPTVALEEHAVDREWLHRASAALTDYWAQKNEAARSATADRDTDDATATRQPRR